MPHWPSSRSVTLGQCPLGFCLPGCVPEKEPWNVSHYIYQLISNGRLNDLSLVYLNKTLPKSYLHVVKAVFVVLQVVAVGTWLFPQATNLITFPLFVILLSISCSFSFYPTFLKQ